MAPYCVATCNPLTSQETEDDEDSRNSKVGEEPDGGEVEEQAE